MKRLLLLLPLLLLSGCSHSLTNEEVIIEKNKCLSGGMDYYIGEYLIGGGAAVSCIKPEVK